MEPDNELANAIYTALLEAGINPGSTGKLYMYTIIRETVRAFEKSKVPGKEGE
jgi:hypothetical protein